MAEDEAWPAGRADLFRGFVGHLLGREESRNHPDWPGKDALAGALAALAEGMQRLGEGTRLPRQEVVGSLPKRVETHDGPVDTDPEVLLRLGLAATLMDTELDPIKGQVVRFYHHQLQEYFAALSLLGAFGRGQDLAERWRRPRLKREMPDPGHLRDDEPLPPPPTTGWEEPTLMAAGLAGKPEALNAAARMVGPEDLIAAVRMAEPVLAARCLSEPGMAPAPGETERTREALLASMGDSSVHLRARIAAGEALGRLGDPRFEAIEVGGARVLLPPIVDIPAGEAILGSSWLEGWRLARKGFPGGDERPRHRLRLPAFGIGKYPVTNAEYACFIADGGYENERWWDTGQARAWRRGELTASYVEDWLNTWRAVKDDPSIMRGQGWSEYSIANWTKLLALEEEQARGVFEQHGAERPMDKPAYWTDERFDNPSQPIVGINWFEARAYCNWLDERWRAAGAEVSRPLGESARVRLPSEAQWERAARLDGGRRYPWGSRFGTGRANTVEGHVLRTAPVGVYPAGASPAGIHDLSGNIWEWCVSLYRDYPIRPGDGRDDPEAEGPRVVRGGSWYFNQRDARCADRFRDLPVFFDRNLGFRVVLSLADSGS